MTLPLNLLAHACARLTPIVCLVALGGSALGAQPTDCTRSADGPPIASARVTIASTLKNSKAVGFAEAYADDLRQLQLTGSYRRFDDGGLAGRWTHYDQALVALLIGVSSRIEVAVDSVTIPSGENRRLFLTVWCVGAGPRVLLGRYWLSASGSPPNVKFLSPLVEYARTGQMTRVGEARIFAGLNAKVDAVLMAESLRVMDELATMLETRVPPTFDVVVVPPRDTTLATLGIFDWAYPIPEYTSLPGPLSVVVGRANGVVGMHELVHLATLSVPMHEMLAEGVPILLAGTNTRDLPELVCDHKEALRTWRGKNLNRLLSRGTDTTGTRPRSEVAAVLGGLLAKVLVQSGLPVRYLQLTPTMIASAEGAKVVAEWDASIPKAIASCAPPG